MNQTVHQLLQLVLQGLAWFLRTIEALWVWSWAQIASVAKISWGTAPLETCIWPHCDRRYGGDHHRLVSSWFARPAPHRGSVLDHGGDCLRRPGRRRDSRRPFPRRDMVVATMPDDFWQKLLQTAASQS